MRIWIDFINTPQVSFWVPFIKDFTINQHEVILTCRDSGNTVDLLKQSSLEFTIIGNKVENRLIKKLFFFPKRIIQLYQFVKLKKPDIAVSQSSFYQPLVAKMLNMSCLYTNDNEHAKGNVFGFLFATKVALPIALKNEHFTKSWFLKSKLQFYPSVKEAIYLSQQKELIELIKKPKMKLYFRPEPWSAQYYNGPLNFFDSMLIQLSKDFQIVILPRDKNQLSHYKKEKFINLEVADKPLKLSEIISDCKLFIGAGGSMTRELAVLNVPVISIYQAKLLCVDKFLVDEGYMNVNPNINYNEILFFLAGLEKKQIKDKALKDGNRSFEMIKEIIINLNNGKN